MRQWCCQKFTRCFYAHMHFKPYCTSMNGLDGFTTVKLSYSQYEYPETVKDKLPLIVIHGLYGAKQNWQSLAKVFAAAGRQVVTVDLRNHGDSPHSNLMSYGTMSADISYLLEELHFQKVMLMGHSLGGKVAMNFALHKPDAVGALIVVDIAPIEYQSGTTLQYANFFKQVRLKPGEPLHVNRIYADGQLKNDIEDVGIRSFLLMNLIQNDDSTQWRLNLDAIIDNYELLTSFPDTDRTYDGPTKFVAGQLSNYIAKSSIPAIQKLFPNADIEHVPNAGHWVHADQPKQFVKVVNDFLDKTQT